jgi:hypothetical protein
MIWLTLIDPFGKYGIHLIYTKMYDLSNHEITLRFLDLNADFTSKQCRACNRQLANLGVGVLIILHCPTGILLCL